jgi:hypothetical protein
MVTDKHGLKKNLFPPAHRRKKSYPAKRAKLE